jgi:hypothetical protein
MRLAPSQAERTVLLRRIELAYPIEPDSAAPRRLRLGISTEHEDVAVWIANLELPVSVRLSLQWDLDERLTTHALVHRAHSSHSEIRVPQPNGTAVREVRLLVTREVEQHEFRTVALQTRINERLVVWNMARRLEAEVLSVPSSRAGDVGDKECGNRGKDLNLGSCACCGVRHRRASGVALKPSVPAMTEGPADDEARLSGTAPMSCEHS